MNSLPSISERDRQIASALLDGELGKHVPKTWSVEEKIRLLGFFYDVFSFYDSGFQLDENFKPIPNALPPLVEMLLRKQVTLDTAEEALQRRIEECAYKWFGISFDALLAKGKP